MISQAEVYPIRLKIIITDQADGLSFVNLKLLLLDNLTIQLIEYKADLEELSQEPKYVKLRVSLHLVDGIVLDFHFIKQG